MYKNHNETKIATSAPTVCDAAKFLREELGADLVVSPKFNSKTGVRIGYFWRWSQRTDVIDNKTYRTYEDALAAGISAVLEPFKQYHNENCPESVQKTYTDFGHLRLTIAAQMMQGLICAPLVPGIDPNPPAEYLAQAAFRLADALIAEAEK